MAKDYDVETLPTGGGDKGISGRSPLKCTETVNLFQDVTFRKDACSEVPEEKPQGITLRSSIEIKEVKNHKHRFSVQIYVFVCLHLDVLISSWL